MTKDKRIIIYKRAKQIMIESKGNTFSMCSSIFDAFSMCSCIGNAYKELYPEEWEAWDGDFKIFTEFSSVSV